MSLASLADSPRTPAPAAPAEEQPAANAVTTPESATNAATTPESITNAATTPESITNAATTPESATAQAATPAASVSGAEPPVTEHADAGAMPDNGDAAGDRPVPAPQQMKISQADTFTLFDSTGGLGTLTPADVDFMPPLLRSLSTLLRLKGKNVSPQFLLANLAGAARITPGACLRAVQKTGLHGSILYRPTMKSISPLTLPCIMLMKDDRSCVLTSLHDNKAQVIFPESGEIPQNVALEKLQAEYSGYALFTTLETQVDARAESMKLDTGRHWFWDVLRFYSPIYRHVAFASIVINCIGVCSPLFVMNVYDRVVPNNAIETLWVLAIGIALAYLFDFVLRTLRNYFVDLAGRNADVVISSSLVDKVLTMRLDARPESTGAMVNNLREFEALRDFFSSSTLLACIDLPFLLIFLFLLGFIGGPLVVLPLVAMPVLFCVGIYLQMASRRFTEQHYKQNMHKNALLVEMVNGLETIKTSMAESRMQRLWEAIVGVSAETSNQGRRYNSLAISISMLVTQLTTVGMVVWGVYRISEGELTMGGLIGCNILLGRAMAPLMQVASLLMRFQNSRVSLQALNLLMDLPSENQDESSCRDVGTLDAGFSLESLSFSYPNAKRASLQGINLRIQPGERVGIVGRMGSGKSTLGKLLVGLYQPSEGAVRLGGVDIRQLSSSDVRGRVGFLPQEVVLFYGTIRDNIALGDPSINDHLIMRAADLSGVSDFVRNNPAGFGAQVGEQGRLLSGGQRQAVALARALVRDSDVLILDEPTSNMDTASEAAVCKRLQSILDGKTLVLVTHRLSMLQMVDRLIVMDNGRIMMDGPKNAVLQRLRNQGQPKMKAAPQAKEVAHG